MRIVAALFLLLTTGSALAAEYQSMRCPNLGDTYCNGEAFAECCGVTLNTPDSGANLAVDAVDGEVTLSGSAATLHACLHLAINTPTAAQIIAGTAPCLVKEALSSAVAGTNAFNSANGKRFTGLEAGTTYAVSYLADEGSQRPRRQLVTTAPFTTPAGGGAGGSDLTGTCYVVDSVNGNDSNNGLTPATAWKTIAKVNNSVTAKGSDVCFMAGSQWNEQPTIDVSGTESDPVVYRAVYVDAGDSNKLVDYDTGTGTGRGARPWIGGDTNDACIAAKNCTTFNGSGSVNSSDAPQINITCVDYVTVKGLRVAYTKGRGISPNCNKFDIGSVGHVLIDGVYLDHIGTISVYIYNGAQNVAVKNSYITRDSICHLQARNTGVQQSNCKATGGGWGGTIVANQYVDNILVEGNVIEDVYGECVGLNRYATNAVGRGNVCRNSHSTSFYCDMATAIFESNIADGAGTGVTDDPSTPFGGGFDAANEKGLFPAKCLFRNNIGFGASGNAAKVAYFPLAEAPAGAGLSAWFFGNTFAGPASGVTVNNGKDHTTDQVGNFVFRTNILFATDVTAGNMASFSNTSGGWAGADFDYNVMNTYPSSARAIGANDPAAGDPLLALGSSMATFRAQGISSPTTVDDARLQSGSPAIGAGDPSLETTAFVSSTLGITLSDWIKDLMVYPYAPDWTNWDKALYYDFEGAARNATTPDAGAVEHAAF